MIIKALDEGIFLKNTDTATDMKLQVLEADGITPVDLATKVVEVVIGTELGRVLVKTPTFQNDLGHVHFGFDNGDLISSGEYYLEIHIMEGLERRVAPSRGYYKLRVTRAIDDLQDEVTTVTLTYLMDMIDQRAIQGPPGPIGPEGLKGEKGDIGLTGPIGLQGPIGLTGIQGPKGDKGDTGATGNQGVQGIQGPKGDRGTDGKSFEVDATGILADRPNFDNELPGFAFLDADNGMLYIRQDPTGWSPPIPFGKGETGDEGPQGPQGNEGPQGPIGLTGPKGDKGDTGLTGPKGDKGDAGASDWIDVENKPTEFPPATHTHVESDITGLGSKAPIVTQITRGSQVITVPKGTPVNVLNFPGKTIINHAPLFDSGLWDKGIAPITVNSSSKATLVASANSQSMRLDVSVKEGQTWTYSHKGDGYVIVQGASAIIPATKDKVRTFTIPVGTTLISIYLTNFTDTAATYFWEDFMLNEGTTAQEFVANVKGITNPTITNTTTGDAITVVGTFHTGDVVDVANKKVTRAKREVVLDGGLGWLYNGASPGFKQIVAPISGLTNKTLKMLLVKYNGRIVLPVGTITTIGEVIYTDGVNIIINIPNADSGWGDAYTPTQAEIQAFMYGWKMYDGAVGITNTSVYNRTDGLQKGWARYDKVSGWQGGLLLPTTKSSTGLDGNGGSYKILYDLASPVTESLKTIGSLRLTSGDNTVELTEGIGSAHATPVTIDYRDTLGGVTEELVKDVTQLDSRLSNQQSVIDGALQDIYSNAKKTQEEAWKTAVLRNGWSGTIKYRKNFLGLLEVSVPTLTAGTVNALTEVTVLDSGYGTPGGTLAVIPLIFNSNGGMVSGQLYVNGDGQIVVAANSTIAVGNVFATSLVTTNK